MSVTHEEPALYGVRRALADGSAVVVRPLEPGEADLLLEVFEQMGSASREARFLAPKPRLTEADVRQLVAVDHVDHEALVALAAEDCRPVGIARFVRDPDEPETAEVAVEVVDRWQSRGLGTMLVTTLLGRARELGVRRFTLVMARDNRAAARLMQVGPAGRARRRGRADCRLRDHADRRRARLGRVQGGLTMASADLPALPVVGTLLGIWAHPDDEAYLSSGLMATARQRGDRVVVVTATRGEHGTDDPELWPPDRLAAHREGELGASLEIVGVEEHHWLRYADGELSGVPLTDGAAELVPLIEQLRPDTIVTFGPEGMTGHGDHRAISAWVTEAWRLTGRRAALWYATLTPEFHAEWGALNESLGIWPEGSRPPVTPHEHLAAHLQLSEDLRSIKHRALRAHASQTGPLEELVGPDRYRAWWSSESFVAATS